MMGVRLFLVSILTMGAIGATSVLVDGCSGGGAEPFAGDDDAPDASMGSAVPEDSGTATTSSDAGAPTCTTATPGCACATTGASVACGQIHRVSGDYVSCSPGFITCGADGVWGDCLGDRVGDPAGPSRGFVLDSLQLDASTCLSNPCDPSCQNYIDTGRRRGRWPRFRARLGRLRRVAPARLSGRGARLHRHHRGAFRPDHHGR